MRFGVSALMVLACHGASVAADPIPVSYQIFCDDPAVAARLSRAVAGELGKSPDLDVNGRLPRARLLLYANRDVEDRVNPNGWSIAIAHVSNVETYVLASKLLNGDQPDARALKPVIAAMLDEQGFLKHLSVGHLDDLSDGGIAIFSRSVVATFLAKVAADAKP